MLMSLAPTGAVLTLSTAVQGAAGGGAAKHFEPWQRRRARQTDWRGRRGEQYSPQHSRDLFISYLL